MGFKATYIDGDPESRKQAVIAIRKALGMALALVLSADEKRADEVVDWAEYLGRIPEPVRGEAQAWALSITTKREAEETISGAAARLITDGLLAGALNPDRLVEAIEAATRASFQVFLALRGGVEIAEDQ
jgi:hypothetical protein